MDFDFQWLLLGMPAAFAIGWLASRFDLRQFRREQKDSPKAYYTGLNLLLNEQHDKAIDAFIEAVQQDPDTSDLHFALGNLFRRRGEYQRAVRVHEHLLHRADLPKRERIRAQHALAQDFMKAGLFDRAEQAYRALYGTDFDTEAHLALLNLHERSRNWPQAVAVARELERSGTASFAARISHYWCEIALEADARQDHAQADDALRQAREAAPLAARPLVLAGQRALAGGAHALALTHWNELSSLQPEAFSLVAADYAAAARTVGEANAALGKLRALYLRAPSMPLLNAMTALEPDANRQRERVLTHLRQQPSLSAAQAVLALNQGGALDEAQTSGLRETIDRAARPLQRYRCAACGFEAHHYFWQCPGCLNWDSYPPQRLDDAE